MQGGYTREERAESERKAREREINNKKDNKKESASQRGRVRE